MTAAQVIAAGDYLKPDFEPSSLTVSQLLGIFGYHNVRYPTPYTKPKLVQLFNDEIKPKVKSFQKERVKAESSIASDDGIVNGMTGEYLAQQQVCGTYSIILNVSKNAEWHRLFIAASPVFAPWFAGSDV